MKFNPDKCEVLRVGRKRALIYHDYILHNKILATANTSKNLGVTITSDLRWNEHVNNITNKANWILGFLKRNLKIRSTSVKNVAYNSLVRLSLEYACSVWDPLLTRTLIDLRRYKEERQDSSWTTTITTQACRKCSLNSAGTHYMRDVRPAPCTS